MNELDIQKANRSQSIISTKLLFQPWVTKSIWAIYCAALVIITLVAVLKFTQNLYQHMSLPLPLTLLLGICVLVLIVLALGSLKRIVLVSKNFMFQLSPFIARHVWLILGIIIFLAFLGRIVWIFGFKVAGFESDYLFYHQKASNYAVDQFPSDSYSALFPHVFGYSYILGLVYQIFGNSILIPQAFNLFLLAIIIGLLLLLFPPKKNPIRSVTVIALCSLWPSFAYFTMLPNTEYVSIVLWLVLFLLIRSYAKTNSFWRSAVILILCMLVAVGSNFIRPIGLIVLIALIIVTLFTLRFNIWQKTLLVGISLIVYYTTASFVLNVISDKIHLEAARLPIGWNLYVGTNSVLHGEDLGLWNPEDSARLSQVHENVQDAQKAHDLMLTAGLQRIQQMQTDNWLVQFMFLKIKTGWGTDSWALQLADSHLEHEAQDVQSYKLFSKLRNPLIAFGDLIYTAFLLFASVLTIKCFRNKMIYSMPAPYLFSALFLIGTFLMLIFVEGAPRYHIGALVAVFIITTSLLRPKQSQNVQTADKAASLG